MINMNIPGWNGEEILHIIGEFASLVPPDGNILEIGALFGRTTDTIGKYKPLNTNLFVIDIWSHVPKSHLMEIFSTGVGIVEKELVLRLISCSTEILSGDDFYLCWKLFTSNIKNLTHIKGHSSMSTDTFPEFDLIIHDGAHDYDTVYADLNNWFPKLKGNGILLIDDYSKDNFDGLVQAVDQYVKENDIETEILTSRNILLRKKQ